MTNSDSLRGHLLNLLTKAEAHVDLRSSLVDFPIQLRGGKPAGAPHTPWQLLEHMRIAQWDILEFSLHASHTSPKWPEDYWPNLRRSARLSRTPNATCLQKFLTAMARPISEKYCS